MAGGIIDSLLIAIGLDTSGVKEGAKDIGKQIAAGAKESVAKLPDQLGPALDSTAARVKGAFSSVWQQIVGPLAGAFAVGGAVSSYMTNALAAGELADKLKVDIEEIQVWSGAMDRAGGSASALQGTIEKLNASGKAQGDAIGVLLDLASQADTMTKEAFVQKAKELEIDEKTIEVLAQGRKALDEHLKRQRELGAYRKEDAENSKKFKQSLADLLQAWDGLTSFIGRLAVPIMTMLADLLTDVVVLMRQHTPFVVAAITLIGAALAYRLMPPLKTLPKLIANVGKSFLRWMPFVAVIAGIALLIDDLYAYISGGKSRFKELWQIFGTGPEIMAKLTTAWKDFKKWGEEVWEGIKTKAKAFWDWMDQWGVLDGIANAFQGLGHIIHGFFSDSEDSGQEMWDGFVQLFGGLFDIIAAPFRAAGEWLGTALSDGIDALEANVADGVAWIVDGLSGIADSVAEAIDAAIEWVAEGLSSAVESAESAIAGFLSSIWTTVTGWVGRLKDWVVEKISGIFSSIKVPSFLTNLFGGSEEETEKAGGKIEDGMGKTASTVEGGFNAAWQGTKNVAISTFQGAATEIQSIFSGILAGIDASAGQAIRNAQALAGGVGLAPAPVGVRAGAGARGSVSNTSNVHIGTMNVQTRATDANGMARGVGSALQRNQLVRAGQSGTVQKG